MIEKENAQISIVTQCDLLSLHRSGVYYVPVPGCSTQQSYVQLISCALLKQKKHLLRTAVSASFSIVGPTGLYFIYITTLNLTI